MKLKKILRIVGVFVYWFILGHLISLWILGKNTIIANIALILYGINILVHVINILVHVIKYISEIISDNKTVKNLKGLFYYLSQSHKERYRCLLKGDTKTAEGFEEIIKISGDAILKVGPSIVGYNTITKKQKKEIMEIVDKTKILLTTNQPSV